MTYLRWRLFLASVQRVGSTGWIHTCQHWTGESFWDGMVAKALSAPTGWKNPGGSGLHGCSFWTDWCTWKGQLCVWRRPPCRQQRRRTWCQCSSGLPLDLTQYRGECNDRVWRTKKIFRNAFIVWKRCQKKGLPFHVTYKTWSKLRNLTLISFFFPFLFIPSTGHILTYSVKANKGQFLSQNSC